MHVITAASFLPYFGDKYLKYLYQMDVNLFKTVVGYDKQRIMQYLFEIEMSLLLTSNLVTID